MGDICESVDTEKEAPKLANNIDNVLKTGGFKVKEWISKKMLKEKVNGDAAKEINMLKGDEKKVLEILWNFKTDKFHSRAAAITEARQQSKSGTEDDQKNDPESCQINWLTFTIRLDLQQCSLSEQR